MFQDANYLEKITIPESVTEIGGFAFSRCTSLKEIVIPKNVMKIGLAAFYKGTNLESVTVKAPEVEYAGDSVYNEDPKVTLHCYIDSTSVAYAKKYGIKYDTSLGKKPVVFPVPASPSIKISCFVSSFSSASETF